MLPSTFYIMWHKMLRDVHYIQKLVECHARDQEIAGSISSIGEVLFP